MLNPQGKVRFFSILDGVRIPDGEWHKNSTMMEWATIVCNLLASADPRYKISKFYFEFENLVNPANTVTVPTFDRTPASGTAYYSALSGSAVRDYLRVPVMGTLIESTDATNYPHGNQITFSAKSAGTTGVHGKAFSNANNSKIFGGALAASPVPNDPTQDLVFARFYLSTGNQKLKGVTGDIGLDWVLPFA